MNTPGLKEWYVGRSRFGIIQEILQRALDGVEEAIHYHVIHIVHIGAPRVQLLLRLEVFQVFLQAAAKTY